MSAAPSCVSTIPVSGRRRASRRCEPKLANHLVAVVDVGPGQWPAWSALVGVRLAAREFGNQQVEAQVKCHVLNRMASLGLPKSERVRLG